QGPQRRGSPFESALIIRSSGSAYPADSPRGGGSASHRPWLSLLDQAGLLNKPRARQGRPRWREERRAGSLLRHPAAQHVPILFDQVVAQPAGCGATGTLPVIPAMQFSTPEERKQNSNRLRLSLEPQGHRYGIKFR